MSSTNPMHYNLRFFYKTKAPRTHVKSLTSKIVSNIIMTAHLHMDLDTLLEGEVMDICTKEMDNLRVSDLEDTVVEDPEPGSGKTTVDF